MVALVPRNPRHALIPVGHHYCPLPPARIALLLSRTEIWGRSGGRTLDGVHVECQDKALEEQGSKLRRGQLEHTE